MFTGEALSIFLFSAVFVLHQLTSRCWGRIRINPPLLAALIFISVGELLLFSVCLFLLLLNYFPHFAPPSVIYVPQTHYTEGDYVIRQGAAGDTFYIISKGQVKFYALCLLHT